MKTQTHAQNEADARKQIKKAIEAIEALRAAKAKAKPTSTFQKAV